MTFSGNKRRAPPIYSYLSTTCGDSLSIKSEMDLIPKLGLVCLETRSETKNQLNQTLCNTNQD